MANRFAKNTKEEVGVHVIDTQEQRNLLLFKSKKPAIKSGLTQSVPGGHFIILLRPVNDRLSTSDF